jgi:hypothetical protein
MIEKRILTMVLAVAVAIVLLTVHFTGFFSESGEATTLNYFNNSAEFSALPSGVVVTDSSPFYALIATPLAVHYIDEGQEACPLLIKNFTHPSSAVERFLETIGDGLLVLDGSQSVEAVSLDLVENYWASSEGVMLIEPTHDAYMLAVNAIPLASYNSMPIIITDELSDEAEDLLEALGVDYSIAVGDVEGYKQTLRLTTLEDIVRLIRETVETHFGSIDYITLTNPLDVREPNVLDSVSYHFEGRVSSSNFLLTQAMGMATGILRGIPIMAAHEFTVPEEYSYARIKIDVQNLDGERADEKGETLWSLFYGPDGEMLAYLFGDGGIPVRDSAGVVLEDRLHYETIMCNNPGDYSLSITGRFLTRKYGNYSVDVTVENLESSLVPLMPDLSSIAPYLTACRKGIILGDPDFGFTNHEAIVGGVISGSAFTASNPALVELSNYHTFQIHETLNSLLAEIRDIDLEATNGLHSLREAYKQDPVHIALVGDTTMIPQYYYFDTDDAVSLYYGWDCPSDFLYGNIDAVPRDDAQSRLSNDTFSYYPFSENSVGRITGWDAQDASALVARTIFYHDLIDDLGDWKNTATVQSGCGTDAQRIFLVDGINRLMGFEESALVKKWPTGASHFENMAISETIKTGDFDVISDENLNAMKEGYSPEMLDLIKKSGILNRIFFPAFWVHLAANSDKINGGIHQETSNFIYSFAHGQPMGFNHGDVLIDAMGVAVPGFPGLVHQLLSRLFPSLGLFLPAGLSARGSYNVRSVENMNMGPSVMMVESCFVGRIDGLYPKNAISQAYVHAGVNTFLASSRGSPGPGYLDLRERPVGLGIKEYLATNKLYQDGDIPSVHLTPLQATLFFTELIETNTDVGTAFRNARNAFLPLDANTTFFWAPPLYTAHKEPNEGSKFLEKKYANLFEYNLLGDPAFNPYEPRN